MYRFITGFCRIADEHEFSKLGQAVDLPEEVSERACMEGAAILPEADFDAIGFTAEEIEKYPTPPLQQEAPADFKAKLKAALVALHGHRESLRGK